MKRVGNERWRVNLAAQPIVGEAYAEEATHALLASCARGWYSPVRLKTKEEISMHVTKLAAVAFAAAVFAPCAFAQSGGVERLYVLECGQGHTGDMSRWTPGQNVNVPMDVVDNCYLIKHAQGYLLWDTGVTDATPANPPPGDPAGITWARPKTLAAQLDQLGIRPDDIKYVAASHTHPDHVGNVELFPKSMLLVQKAEYEWPNAQGGPRFKPGHPVTKLEGDRDVFGDGSVTILSTPGHTPGHQSLLVKLPKTGTVVLSGDAVHFKANFEARNVPGGNTDKGQTLASMSRMSDIMGQQKAQLWINHDKEQRQTMKMSPAFYE
jgi:N-acyl homoserine lactone hydrolase